MNTNVDATIADEGREYNINLIILCHSPISNILYRCIRAASAAEAIIEGIVTSCLSHIRCHRPLLRVHV